MFVGCDCMRCEEEVSEGERGWGGKAGTYVVIGAPKRTRTMW